MDLQNAIMVSASGLRAQSLRMRVIAENLANQDSVAPGPGQDPYRRKIVTFASELDRAAGVETVSVENVTFDKSDFGTVFDPGHPAADENGYVATANVNGLVEALDMRQAQRTYESNLNAIETSRNMMVRTVELLR